MTLRWFITHHRDADRHQLKSTDQDQDQAHLSYSLQFWLLLGLGVPSLICSLLILYQYFFEQTRRRALHNHMILLIITTNILLMITDLAWMLDSFRHSGRVFSPTPAFCMTWWFLDYSLYTTQTVILAWASIERHLLIFHSHLMSTRRKRFLYHYLPPTLLILYVMLFYAWMMFIPPCKNQYNFNVESCGSDPCYAHAGFLGLWDALVNSVIPTLIIGAFSVALLYRTVVQKRRLGQANQRRKLRHMSIQLLALAGVYLFLNFPLAIIMLVQLISYTGPQTGFGTQLYVFFLTYSVTLSLPFVVCLRCLSSDSYRHRRVSPFLTRILHRRMFALPVATIQ